MGAAQFSLEVQLFTAGVARDFHDIFLTAFYHLFCVYSCNALLLLMVVLHFIQLKYAYIKLKLGFFPKKREFSHSTATFQSEVSNDCFCVCIEQRVKKTKNFRTATCLTLSGSNRKSKGTI